MKCKTNTILGCLTFASRVSAALLNADLPPLTTIAAGYDARGTTSKPTAAPKVHKLRPRDLVEGETRFVAPNNTCGYISGDYDRAYSCANPSGRCAILTSSARGSGGILCCDENAEECASQTVRCFDRAQALTMRDVDAFALTCSQSQSAFCRTVSISPGILDYFCGSARTSREASLSFTGQDPVEFTALWLRDGTTRSLVVTDIFMPISDILTSSDSSTTTTTSWTQTSSAVRKPDGGGGNDLPVGAIVGGAIGGVAILVLLALGIFFYTRRRTQASRNNHHQTFMMQEQQQQQQQQPPPPHQQPQTYTEYPKNNAHHNVQHSSPQTGTVSSPTLTDTRISYMSASSPPIYVGEMARGSPSAVLCEAPTKNSERREHDAQELP